ncbi:MAG: baseplate protein [Acidiphilium sp. 34-60-192]|nr:MAG: baseplate protein [Acidiphilium sp. 34-60-192]
MQLSLQSFSTMVETMAASIQGAVSQFIDLSVGSVMRSLLEANAAIASWLQWLIVQVLQANRLATSVGADCDSFGADFGFTRLAAAPASGVVTFARFAPVLNAFVPVGTIVITVDGSQSFAVTAAPANPAFTTALNGYTLTVPTASIDLPVTALVPGSAGNILAQNIGLIGTVVAGIDTATNNAAFSGGVDQESDAAFRARFGNYLASLSRATLGAVQESIAGVQQGLSATVAENVDPTGATSPGEFVVTVDDGSGAPPASLLSTVQLAVDAVRPVGTRFSVQPPHVTQALVTMMLTLTPGAVQQNVVAAVQTAVGAYIDNLPVGATLAYTRLAQIAYDASTQVVNVTGVELNAGNSDLTPGPFGAVRSGSMSITAS